MSKPLNVLIIPDKFKGTASASQVAVAIERGVRDSYPSAIIHLLPMADGGDGSSEIIANALNGQKLEYPARNVLLQKMKGVVYSVNGIGFLDVATCSGLAKLPEVKRNTLSFNTFGTGELMRQALKTHDHLVVSLGGSATTDLGCGAAQACGFLFLDNKGIEINPIPENFLRIKKIVSEEPANWLRSKSIVGLTDVQIPLTGPDGTVYNYASQKGAKREQLSELEQWVEYLATLMEDTFNVPIRKIPGAGAAGGFGAGIIAFFNGELKQGAEYILSTLNGVEEIHWADVIITGEGKFDLTSYHGKVISKIIDINGKNKPIFIICGSSDLPSNHLMEKHIQINSLLNVFEESQAMENPEFCLTEIAKNLTL